MRIRSPLATSVLAGALSFCLSATSPVFAQDREIAQRRVNSALEAVADTVGNRVIFNGNAAELEELLQKYSDHYTPAELTAIRDQLALHRAAHQKIAVAEDLERAGQSLNELEKQWADAQAILNNPDESPNSRDGAVEDVERSIADVQVQLTKLPADQTAALSKRLVALQKDFGNQVNSAGQAAKLEELTGYWQRDTADSEGWQNEAGIDFSTYVSASSQANSAFGLPKTLERYDQANRWLQKLSEDSAAPPSFVAEIRSAQVETRARLLRQVKLLVAAGIASSAGDERNRNALTRLDESLRINLNADTDAEFGALKVQTAQWLAAAVAADTSSEEGRAEYYRRMTVSASAAWPAMEQQFADAGSFDPTDDSIAPGTLVRIDTDNLMGWDFKVGDFPFATTINGMAVAAIYHPDVAAAIAEVEEKMGRALGDSDDDGRWTIIAEVTGKRGQMRRRVQHDGDIRDSGSGAKIGTWSGESAETTEAPIIRIVAAHVGPLAVAKGVGVAQADGSLRTAGSAAPVGAPTASSGAGSGGGSNAGSGGAGGGLLWRTGGLLLGLLAAAACLLQARPELVVARAGQVNGGAAAMAHRLRSQLFAIGLLLMGLGLFWLLRGWVYLDLLPASAVIAAGLYAAAPGLRERKLLSATQPQQLSPFGLPLAAAVSGIALLHLLFGGAPLL